MQNHFQQEAKDEVEVFFSSFQIQGFQNLSVPFFNFFFLRFFFNFFFFPTFEITVINRWAYFSLAKNFIQLY